jgi:hypothetical protein
MASLLKNYYNKLHYRGGCVVQLKACTLEDSKVCGSNLNPYLLSVNLECAHYG